MYKRRESTWLKHLDFIAMDFVVLQVALLIAYWLRHGTLVEYATRPIFSLTLIVALMDVIAIFSLHNYKNILRRSWKRELVSVFQLVATVYVGVILWLFVMKQTEDFSRIMLVLFPSIAVVLSFAVRIVLKHYLRTRKRQDWHCRGIFLVCNRQNCRELLDNFIKDKISPFRVRGVAVLDDADAQIELPDDITFIRERSELLNFLAHEWVDEVFFCTELNPDVAEELVLKCLAMGITVHRALIRIRKSTTQRTLEQMGGYMVMSQSINIVDSRKIVIKRLVDVIAGLVGTAFTGILCLIVGPIIYAKSPGPIFFKQERIGQNGRRFNLYKFRSMYMDAEERKKELMEKNNIKDGYMFKVDDDPRIIKGIGNFIRNYSIDEFPQFYNVLKGDMSLIGTRPPTPDEWEKYKEHHRARLAVKPGITGAWQVSGRSDITDFEEVVKLDVEYIKHWSLGLDLKIIFKTIGVVLSKKGADNR